MIGFKSCSDYAQHILRGHKNYCKAFDPVNTFVQVDWSQTDLFHVQAQYQLCPRLYLHYVCIFLSLPDPPVVYSPFFWDTIKNILLLCTCTLNALFTLLPSSQARYDILEPILMHPNLEVPLAST